MPLSCWFHFPQTYFGNFCSCVCISVAWSHVHLDCGAAWFAFWNACEKYEVMIVFAGLIEAEAKELILDIKYPVTKKQVNI